MLLFRIFQSGLNIAEILVYLLGLVLACAIAIVCHEVAHGFVALKCGDNTAKMHGRLTANPVAHFDLFGFLMLLIVGFGWAKPVPVNPNNFKDYKKGTIAVASAGIITNLVLCGISLLLLFLLAPYLQFASNSTAYILKFFTYTFLVRLAQINFMLAFFNLLPIYPLDGFRLVDAFLKPGNGFSLFMRRNGNYILIGLIVLSSLFSMLNLEFLDVFYWASSLIEKLISAVT